jgi:NAD+ synthase
VAGIAGGRIDFQRGQEDLNRRLAWVGRRPGTGSALSVINLEPGADINTAETGCVAARANAREGDGVYIGYIRIMATLSEQMAAWLRQHVEEAGARGIVVGLSGGIDSAVVARVAQLAMGEAVLAAILPAYSDPQDERDARLVANHFSLRTIAVELSVPLDSLLAAANRALDAQPRSGLLVDETADRLATANIKPRLRMTTLYFLANRFNYLLAGTGNRSEIAVGYYTKYGDGGVDLLPLGSLVKSQIVALARDLDVPARIVDKAPSAGLWSGQTDEGEMGFTYANLETYLLGDRASLPPGTVTRIAGLARASEHKRRLPPVFEPA